MPNVRYVELRIMPEHILLNCWETIKWRREFLNKNDLRGWRVRNCLDVLIEL
jgi:hypothetical protein